MRPPILHWKVFLGLLVVVVAGASVGSALHSDGMPHRSFYVYGVNAPHHVGGWTGYQPNPAKMPPQFRREVCAALRAQIPRTRKPFRHGSEQNFRELCRRRG